MAEQNDFQHPYKKFEFPGMRKDEEIVLMLRRHWLVLVVKFFPLFLATAFIAFLFLSDSFLAETFLIFDLDQNLFRWVFSFIFMFFWVMAFAIWIDYYFDVWIVTNERIMNMEQFGLFRREVSELEHEKIQDVTTEVHGFFSTIFNFGYVHIQTAGERSRFVFKQVPNPQKVRQIIMRLQEQAVKEGLKEEGQILRGKA